MGRKEGAGERMVLNCPTKGKEFRNLILIQLRRKSHCRKEKNFVSRLSYAFIRNVPFGPL